MSDKTQPKEVDLLDYAISVCLSLPTYDIGGNKIEWTKEDYETHWNNYKENHKQ